MSAMSGSLFEPQPVLEGLAHPFTYPIVAMGIGIKGDREIPSVMLIFFRIITTPFLKIFGSFCDHRL